MARATTGRLSRNTYRRASLTRPEGPQSIWNAQGACPAASGIHVTIREILGPDGLPGSTTEEHIVPPEGECRAALGPNP
jgi:hypothetical protein